MNSDDDANTIRATNILIKSFKKKIAYTGLTPAQLIKDSESKLKPPEITMFLSGKLHYVQKSFIEELERLCSNAYIDITPAIIEEILGHSKRTRLSISRLLTASTLTGMRLSTISGWLNGRIKKAPKNTILKVCKAFSEIDYAKIKPVKNNKDSKVKKARDSYIEITQEMSEFVKKEIARTGLGAVAILENVDNIPKGVNSYQIKKVLYGKTDILPEIWEEIQGLWSDIHHKTIRQRIIHPNDILKNKSNKDGQYYWDARKADRLKCLVKSTGLSPSELLSLGQNTPASLNDDRFIELLLGLYKGKIAPEIIDYICQLCEKHRNLPTGVKKDIEYKEITNDKRQALLDEQQRTGISIYKILSMHNRRDINAHSIVRIAHKKQHQCNPKDIELVLALYRESPDKSDQLKTSKNTSLP